MGWRFCQWRLEKFTIVELTHIHLKQNRIGTTRLIYIIVLDSLDRNNFQGCLVRKNLQFKLEASFSSFSFFVIRIQTVSWCKILPEMFYTYLGLLLQGDSEHPKIRVWTWHLFISSEHLSECYMKMLPTTNSLS